MEISPTAQLEKFSGWDSLTASDRATLLSLIKKNPSTSKGSTFDLVKLIGFFIFVTHTFVSGKKAEHEEEGKLLQQSASKGGAKRKRVLEGDQKSKIAKAGGDASSNKTSVLENQLEMQTRVLWALKDDLKKHVTTSELREMLEVNEQNSRGSELDLRERW